MCKYLMKSMAAVCFCGFMAGCSHDFGIDDGTSVKQSVEETYEKAFVTHFGEPASDRTWGFGPGASATRAKTRSIETPECPNINQPYDEDWVTEYLATAKEPNSENIVDDWDHSHYEGGSSALWYSWIGDAQTLQYNPNGFTGSADDRNLFETYCRPFFEVKNSWDGSKTWPNDYFGCADEAAATQYLYDILSAAGKWSSWVNGVAPAGQTWVPDETYVTNFKITGSYTGQIPMAASEGSQNPGTERTIVVTGTWEIQTIGESHQQKIGSLGKIIIANGGTVNVTDGTSLHFVNQAQLVVLPGGTLTGNGTVEINNGTAVGHEAYNGGTIDVNHFNNNFGKFYNYGKFLVNEYDAGSTESNFYNHALVNIDHTGNTPNARIFNACQFYVQNDARLRIYEGVNGSALIVGGEFMPFGSADGTSVVSYVSLAEGALVKCNTLYNGSSWTGPTEGGYGALEIVDHIEYLTWAQDNPAVSGYFANNLYIKCGTWENDPSGQGKHYDGPINSEWDQINYDESRAEYKIWSYAANCTGNGNVTKVVDSDNVVWPADEDFILGEDGCTPGFKGDVPPEDPQEEVDEIMVIAEDLTVNDARPDFDFNDVVFTVKWNKTKSTVTVTLLAAGGTLPLYIGGTEENDYTDGYEVHAKFAEENPNKVITTGTMINTYENRHKEYKTPTFAVTNFKNSAQTIGELANSIKVAVKKYGEMIELTAPAGQVPTKIGVGKDFEWCDERQDIDDKYRLIDGTPLFKDYVQGKIGDDWYQMIKDDIDSTKQ